MKSGHIAMMSSTVVPRFKPKRDVMISSRTVACPICKADVNEWCVKVDGSPMTRARTTHTSRRRMAIRKLNNDQSE